MKHFLLSLMHTDSSFVGLLSLDDLKLVLLEARHQQVQQADEDLVGLLYLDIIPLFFEEGAFSIPSVSAEDFHTLEEEGWVELLTRPLYREEPTAMDGEHLVVSKKGIYWFGFSTDNDANEFFETAVIPYDKLFDEYSPPEKEEA